MSQRVIGVKKAAAIHAPSLDLVRNFFVLGNRASRATEMYR